MGGVLSCRTLGLVFDTFDRNRRSRVDVKRENPILLGFYLAKIKVDFLTWKIVSHVYIIFDPKT